MTTPLPTRMPGALMAAAVALALAGCASAPRQDAALDAARTAVTSAHNDPQVAGDARAELTTADSALSAADALMAGGKPLADVDHQAYLAQRYAEAAQQHGQLIASTAAIAELGTRRNAVLLRAREGEAQRATTLAGAMAADAGNARREAAASAVDSAAANERADRLDAQLTELQGKRTERGVVVTLGDVLFATNQSNLQEGSQRAIDKLTAFLVSHPTRTVRVEGFTDNVGGNDYNRGLSDRRAGSVAEALSRSGVDRSRIQMEGYGEAFPVAGNGTATGRQQNRRVEVIISEDGQRIADRTE